MIFRLGHPTNALENLNTVDIGSARRVEHAGGRLIPIGTHLQAGNVNSEGDNKNSENSPTDGKSKILMEVGHPKNDKVRFSNQLFNFNDTTLFC